MKLFDYDRFEEIMITLGRNKSRSVLTAFGVFWGVMMLIVLLGGGNGLKYMMATQIKGVELSSCIIFPNNTSKPYKGYRTGRWWGIKIGDLDIIRQRIPEIDELSPLVFSWSNSATDNTVFKDRSGNFSIQGKAANYNKVVASEVLKGRFFNDLDIQQARKVCLIGEKVYSTLFTPGQNPVGEYIRVAGVYYQVIGVLRKVSQAINFGGDPDETISIPFTTMQNAYRLGDEVHILFATTKKGHPVAEAEERIKEILREQHTIAPDDKKAVQSVNIEKQAQIFSSLFLGVDILILIVGIGTLFAGAIGVSNIMMVTVKERTQEIGIRRALGAKPWTIVSQIMSETIVLTVMAGALGIVIGVLILQGVGSIGGLEGFMLSFGSAIGAGFILVVFSLIASLAPALRAMKIKAIDALRDE